MQVELAFASGDDAAIFLPGSQLKRVEKKNAFGIFDIRFRETQKCQEQQEQLC